MPRHTRRLRSLQVAYSGTFHGAGIIAAGPYDCGQGNVMEFATCDIGASLPALEQQAVTRSSHGLIDPISNLAGRPIYVYHGALDPVINDLVSDSGDGPGRAGQLVAAIDDDPVGDGRGERAGHLGPRCPPPPRPGR